MRIYSPEQKDKYYLSPYVHTIYADGCLVLRQELFDSWVSIPCSNEIAFKIISELENGADEETLSDLLCFAVLHQEDAVNYLSLLQQAGVLE